MIDKPRIVPADDAPHVLVVDDDRRLRELLSRFLSENGYRVTSAADAASARRKLDGFVFDCLILDVMMPGENGFELARFVRQSSAVPILMLTARTDANDRVQGLEIGADDYVAKPFEPRELLLRLNNIQKRSAALEAVVEPNVVRFGPYRFRPDRGELRRDNEIVRITERERDILALLAARAGDTVPREDLSGGLDFNERTVDVQINRLRRKIEDDPGNPLHLQTVRGVGYRLLVDH